MFGTERFNQLREIRQKHKDGALERPFSRMHNFFVLDRGEKWANTGTTFRPKHPRYAPEVTKDVAVEPAGRDVQYEHQELREAPSPLAVLAAAAAVEGGAVGRGSSVK
eukprot:763527-Hanusia_phi.AAC.2